MSIGGISSGLSDPNPMNPSNIQTFLQELEQFLEYPTQANQNKLDNVINTIIKQNPKMKSQMENIKKQLNQYFSLSRKYGVLDQELNALEATSQKNQLEEQLHHTKTLMQSLKDNIKNTIQL